jgi:hypothetical protein
MAGAGEGAAGGVRAERTERTEKAEREGVILSGAKEAQPNAWLLRFAQDDSSRPPLSTSASASTATSISAAVL